MPSEKSLDDATIAKDVEQVTSSAVEESDVLGVTHEITKAEAKRILLKTDLVVMPLIVLAMTLAFLDKVHQSTEIGTLITVIANRPNRTP